MPSPASLGCTSSSLRTVPATAGEATRPATPWRERRGGVSQAEEAQCRTLDFAHGFLFLRAMTDGYKWRVPAARRGTS
jgi:hypothetical protein